VHNRDVDTLTFRHLDTGDEALLFRLYAAVRSAELGMEGWQPELRDRILRVQFEAQRRGYREQFPHADERLILRDGSAIGWVTVDRSGAGLHGIDIALLADERSRGVGTRVIQALQEEAAAENRLMAITVLRPNVRALALYRRLGFRETGGTETHIVMEWRRDAAREAGGASRDAEDARPHR
jgi:ribosomal protein S18 acetylase RimI-like enzyme